MTETERIIDQLKRAFDGEPWYGDSLNNILTDVTAQIAAARLFPNALSIWELVLHLTFTEEIMRRRIEGEAAEFSDREDFPPVEDMSEAAWRETLENLANSHRKLIATISSLADAQLNDTVTGRDHSKYFLLHGLIQHLIYHAGQVALLKKGLRQQNL
jgi:uncharacterized damage-inducible protein DinB